MPPGPPPGGSDSEDEDEDVQMAPDFVPPLPPGKCSPYKFLFSIEQMSTGPPPPNAILAPGFVPSYNPILITGIPPPPPFPPTGVPPPPPLPMGGFSQIPLAPPPGFPSLPLNMPSPQAAANLPPGAIPPPPFGFPNFPPNFPSSASPTPRGFRGPHAQPFDPLALPTVSGPPSRSQVHPSLPKRPPPPSSNTLALDDNSSAATVSAAPELRDFKKEAMSFVPRGIRHKALDKGNTGVNAAPSTEDADTEIQDAPRPDLMKTLAAAGITGRAPATAPEEKQTVPQTTSKPSKGGNKDQQDEYERFMADIGDLI